MREGPEDLLVRGPGLVELSQLEERAAEAVASLGIVGRDLEDLLVQVGGALPVGLERRGDRLIRERTHAEGRLSWCGHLLPPVSNACAREGRTYGT